MSTSSPDDDGTSTRSPNGAAPATLLTLDEAAAALRISERTLKRLVDERRVPYIRFGRRAPMFKPSDVDQIVELHRHEAVTPSAPSIQRRRSPLLT